MADVVTLHGENRRTLAPADLQRALSEGGIPVVHTGKIIVPEDVEYVPNCPCCHVALTPGTAICLVPIGPGADPEARRAARMSVRFMVATLEVCWACATGQEPVAEPAGDPEPPRIVVP